MNKFVSKLQIKSLWDKFSQVPKGKYLFSRMIGQVAPYTGSLKATVLEIGDTSAKAQLKERRFIRNHLNSVHAAALMNFAELSSGLYINYHLPLNYKSILVAFNIEYKKKARGVLTSECHSEPLVFEDGKTFLMTSVIKNDKGEEIARATATWLVGLRNKEA